MDIDELYENMKEIGFELSQNIKSDETKEYFVKDEYRIFFRSYGNGNGWYTRNFDEVLNEGTAVHAYENNDIIVDSVRKRVNDRSFIYMENGSVEYFLSFLIIDKENKTSPQEKYQKKAGLVSKSYKLNKKLVDDFANACEAAETSQAKQLSILMQDFIDKNRSKYIK